MVDMRKRFRGNYPVALSVGSEGGGGSRQLYGGGSALGGPPSGAKAEGGEK